MPQARQPSTASAADFVGAAAAAAADEDATEEEVIASEEGAIAAVEAALGVVFNCGDAILAENNFLEVNFLVSGEEPKLKRA